MILYRVGHRCSDGAHSALQGALENSLVEALLSASWLATPHVQGVKIPP